VETLQQNAAIEERVLALAHERRALTEQQVRTVRQLAAQLGRPLGEILVRMHLLTPESHLELRQEVLAELGNQQRLAQWGLIPEAPGTRIRDYEILGALGSGANGTVYKARHVRLGRMAALKLLHAGGADSAGVRRFRTEAAAIARLQHPNIVAVYDAGHLDGRDFIAMELAEGETLSERLSHGVLREEGALTLARDVAHALAHAHAAGVVHRDLKPDNIIFDRGGQPKVADFGLARMDDMLAARSEGEESELTQAGALLGTPLYMSPEQASGQPAEERSDQFALGVILYEALTGKRPFGGDTLGQVLVDILSREPKPPRQLNPQLSRETEAICLKALEKDPSRRYASAQALANDLDRRLRGEPTAARPLTPAQRLVGRARRAPVVTAGLAVACFLALGLAAVSARALSQPGRLRVVVRPQTDADWTLRVAPLNAADTTWHEARLPAASEGRVTLTPGPYRLVVERPGFQAAEREAVLVRGQESALVVELAHLTGEVKLTVDPPGALIELAPGTPHARQVGSFFDGHFPIGRHRVRVSRRGFYPAELELVVVAGQVAEKHVTLPAALSWEQSTSGFLSSVRVGAPRAPRSPSRVVLRNRWSHFQLVEARGGAANAPRELGHGPTDSGDGWSIFNTPIGTWIFSLGKLGAELIGPNDEGASREQGWFVRGEHPAGLSTTSNTLVLARDLFYRLSTREGVVTCHGAGGALRWQSKPPTAKRGSYRGGLSAADLGGDASLELVAVAGRELTVYEPRGGRPLAQATLPAAALHAALLADLDGDQKSEAVLSLKGFLVAWDPEAGELWRRELTGSTETSAPALRLAPDGWQVVVATRRGEDIVTLLFDARDGRLLRELDVTLARSDASPVAPLALDWNNDGHEDVALAAGGRARVVSLAEAEPTLLLDHVVAERDLVQRLVTADLDGDGWLDLLALSKGGRTQRLTPPRILWQRRIDTGTQSRLVVSGQRLFVGTETSVAVFDLVNGRCLFSDPEARLHGFAADVNGDGREDTLLFRRGHPELFGADQRRLWVSKIGDGGSARPLLFDEDGDGDLDLAVATAGSTTGSLNLVDGADGIARWEVKNSKGYWGHPLALGDLVGDERPELVALDQGGTVQVYETRGQSRLVWSKCPSPVRPGAAPTRNTPVLHDVDGDGDLDVVFVAADGWLTGLRGDTGAVLWKADLGASPVSSALAWDANPGIPGDELLVVGEHEDAGALLFCLSRDLRDVIYATPLGGPALARPACGDVDGDGRPEVVVATGTGPIDVFAGEGGGLLWTHRVPGRNSYKVAPLVLDVDGDGAAEIIAASREGNLTVFRGGGRAGLRRAWTHARGDWARTGRARGHDAEPGGGRR
jgi:outer membrane protein assembly factor BamB